MKRVLLALGAMAIAAASAGLLACSGILGIGVASQEADDGGTGAEAAADLSCPHYCALMDKNCNWVLPSKYGEYETLQTCLDMCQAIAWDHGNGIAASDNDTLGCRIHYAEQAANDPAKNCRFAGLLGGGRCGTSACDNFCTLDVGFCDSDAVNTPAYRTVSECLGDCKGVDGGIDGGDGGSAGYPYLSGNGDGGELFNTNSGNTLNCRLWHLNAAFQPGQGLAGYHCAHTELISTFCHN